MNNNTDIKITAEEAKKRNRLISAYETVFKRSGRDGFLVFRDILNELQFFSFTGNKPEDIILSNIAKKIMFKAGIWDKGNIDNIVESFLRIEPVRQKESDK